MSAAETPTVKKEREEHKIVPHFARALEEERAQWLMPGKLKGVLQREWERLKDCPMALIMIHEASGNAESQRFLQQRVMMTCGLMDKTSSPRAITPYQMVFGAVLNCKMRGVGGFNELHKHAVMASLEMIQQAEDVAVRRVASLAGRGKSVLMVIDNLDYSQGSKYYSKDNPPTFINTVNLVELSAQVPYELELWKQPSALDNPVEAWTTLQFSWDFQRLWSAPRSAWEFLWRQAFELSQRPGRPGALLHGTCELHVLEPVLPGDLVMGTDQGYQKSLGLEANVLRILRHFAMLYQRRADKSNLMVVGDEQTFESMLKVLLGKCRM